MGRRKPAPVVPPPKTQVVERKTIQLGEFPFETRRPKLSGRGRRAVSIAHERDVLRMTPSPFEAFGFSTMT